MHTEQSLRFHSFRLDLANAQLWHNSEEIVLRRKTFDVLRYLVEHPGQLVTKDALLDTVWAGAAVGDSMPAICVGELRKALHDDVKTPQLIETAHGRGYRFIAKVTLGGAPPAVSQLFLSTEPIPIVVGREQEFQWLCGKYEEARAGSRRVIFVAGEAGIGKTTFVRMFLNSLDAEQVRIGRGQCVEQYGAGEPYMPILEALTRLGQQSGGGEIIEMLDQQAPSWLAQMPSLLSDSERERLQSAAQGVTQPRMLREMGSALDAITA